MTGAFAFSAALFQRERSGRGQRIDMAMLNVAMILMSSLLTAICATARIQAPRQPPPAPTNGPFRARRAGHARRRQPAPAAPPIDAARPSRDDQEDQRRARRRPRRIAVLSEIMLTRTADQWRNSCRSTACRRRGCAPWVRRSPIRGSRAAASSTAAPMSRPSAISACHGGVQVRGRRAAHRQRAALRSAGARRDQTGVDAGAWFNALDSCSERHPPHSRALTLHLDCSWPLRPTPTPAVSLPAPYSPT